MERVLSRFSGVIRSGDGYKALCPCHEDFSPSLWISEGSGGRILLRCLAGCPTDAVMAEVGLTWGDLMGDHPSPSAPRVRAALDETAALSRDEVYSDLIAGLTLSGRHRSDLLRRGLDDRAIEAAGYRSLSYFSSRKVLRSLHEKYGEELYKVPGIADDAGKPLLVPQDGLLIPVRDLKARVVGCQVRVGEPGAKYKWLSCRTARSGSPCHCSLRSGGTSGLGLQEVWVTEGPLKADVARHLKRWSFLGVAGTTAAMSAKAVIDQIGVVSKVVLAFDMDWMTNDGVRDKLTELYLALTQGGYEVVQATWHGHKGIDDALLKGVKIDVGELIPF